MNSYTRIHYNTHAYKRSLVNTHAYTSLRYQPNVRVFTHIHTHTHIQRLELKKPATRRFKRRSNTVPEEEVVCYLKVNVVSSENLYDL